MKSSFPCFSLIHLDMLIKYELLWLNSNIWKSVNKIIDCYFPSMAYFKCRSNYASPQTITAELEGLVSLGFRRAPRGTPLSSIPLTDWGLDFSPALSVKEVFSPFLFLFIKSKKPLHTFALTLSHRLGGQTCACQRLWFKNTDTVIWFHLKPPKDLETGIKTLAGLTGHPLGMLLHIYEHN